MVRGGNRWARKEEENTVKKNFEKNTMKTRKLKYKETGKQKDAKKFQMFFL
jgi:hypothetical protein